MGHPFDQNISDRQHFFGRVSIYDFARRTPTGLPANVSLSVNTGANVAASYNFIFSPTLLYEFTGGYNRATIPFGNEPLGQDFRDAVGENFSPEVPLGFLPSSQVLTGSRYNFASFVSYDLANPDDSFQFNNSLKKVAGKHAFSLGFNVLHWRHFVGVQGTSNLQYSPLTTALSGFTGTGESLASFFLGLPTQTSYGFGEPKKTHGNIYVAYAGDTWKITPKLTATLGLQYVYASPPIGNQVSAMDVDLARTQPLARDFTFAYIWASENPITGAAPNASRGLLNPDRNNLASRAGLSYSLLKDTVIRTGFGIFYDYNTNLIQNNNARGFAYPFAVSRIITGQNLNAPGPAQPIISLDQPLYAVHTQPGTVWSATGPVSPRPLRYELELRHRASLACQPPVGSGLCRVGRPQTLDQCAVESGARGHGAHQRPAALAQCRHQSVHHQTYREFELQLDAGQTGAALLGWADLPQLLHLVQGSRL